MATYNKFEDFSDQLIRGVHDFDAHSFKVAITNTLPVASQIGFDPVTNHPSPAAMNGYTPGGAVSTLSITEVTGLTTVQGTQVVFTATGGQIGPFRYVLLYNDTAAADNLICWWDYGTAITLNDGESFTVKFNNASPGTVFTLV